MRTNFLKQKHEQKEGPPFCEMTVAAKDPQSTVCKIAIFARNGVGYYSQMIALKMAISSNMQGAKNSCSLHL